MVTARGSLTAPLISALLGAAMVFRTSSTWTSVTRTVSLSPCSELSRAGSASCPCAWSGAGPASWASGWAGAAPFPVGPVAPVGAPSAGAASCRSGGLGWAVAMAGRKRAAAATPAFSNPRNARIRGAESAAMRAGGQELGAQHLEIRLFFAYEGAVVTRRQKQVLDFVQAHLKRHGFAPSLEEIGRHLGVASLATVHQHLTRLESRGVIRRRAHQSRSVEVLDRAGNGGVTQVPFLGRVAAGRPIEPVEKAESGATPEDLSAKGESFALRGVGDWMIGDGILDGDVVVVESRPDAPNGATVVALGRGEATGKRFYRGLGAV